MRGDEHNFPGCARSVADARSWVGKILAGVPDTVREDAIAIVSELCANAVEHTRSGAPGGSYRVSVDTNATWVRVGVIDSGGNTVPPVPAVPPDDPLDDHGRGLLLVQEIALAWWTVTHGTDRMTVAEIPIPVQPRWRDEDSNPRGWPRYGA